MPEPSEVSSSAWDHVAHITHIAHTLPAAPACTASAGGRLQQLEECSCSVVKWHLLCRSVLIQENQMSHGVVYLRWISLGFLCHCSRTKNSSGTAVDASAMKGWFHLAGSKKKKDLAKIITLVPSLVKENVCMTFCFNVNLWKWTKEGRHDSLDIWVRQIAGEILAQ